PGTEPKALAASHPRRTSEDADSRHESQKLSPILEHVRVSACLGKGPPHGELDDSQRAGSFPVARSKVWIRNVRGRTSRFHRRPCQLRDEEARRKRQGEKRHATVIVWRIFGSSPSSRRDNARVARRRKIARKIRFVLHNRILKSHQLIPEPSDIVIRLEKQ